MLFISLFASIGIFLIYFALASALDYPILQEGMPTGPTMAVLIIVAMFFTYMMGAFNSSLALAYRRALTGQKTSLGAFYAHALKTAPVMFGIVIARELAWLVAVGSIIAAYYIFAADMEIVGWLVGFYALFMTFLIHMFFTPSLITASIMDTYVVAALKRGMVVLRRRHVGLLIVYILFALVWLLNFVPLLGLVTIFFLYPITYSALIVLTSSER